MAHDTSAAPELDADSMVNNAPRIIVIGLDGSPMRHRLAGALGHRLICRNDAPVVVVVP
jgi:hypothetical protein